MNCSMPGFPVLHYLPEFAQTQVHWVHDAIQLSYSLSPLSPPALHLSQHQGLSQWVSSSHQVAKVLELQYSSFQWIFRVHFLYGWLVWSPCCRKDSQESSSAPQFKNINSLCSAFFLAQISHPYLTTGKAIALTVKTLCQKSDVSDFQYTV